MSICVHCIFIHFSPEIKNVWENRKTITANLRDIGLGWDPNKIIKIPNAKEEREKMMKKMHGFIEEDNPPDSKEDVPIKRSKGFVMEQMEADANALRESNFRFVFIDQNYLFAHFQMCVIFCFCFNLDCQKVLLAILAI